VIGGPLPRYVFETALSEQQRELEHSLRVRDARRRPTLADRDPVVIRLDRVQDENALSRLAVLNGEPTPMGDHVVAEVRGTVVAALPLDGGRPLCDWIAAAHLIPLLELRAAQITGDRVEQPRRRGLVGRRWLRARSDAV
jgi:hypothetical protein